MRKSIIILLVISFIGIFGAEAKKLPTVKLKNLAGKTVDTGTLSNNGKPMIISFFALWCKPCLREMSAISEVYDNWQKETGVKLIAVSIDDSRSSYKVEAEVNAREFPGEVLLDPNSDFKRAMNVNLIPHTVIVDGNGEIVWQHSSYADGDENEIIKVLRELKGLSTKNGSKKK